MDIIFTLQSTTDGSLLTGQEANVTVYLSVDGGSFAASTNAAQEIGRGAYKLTLTSAEAAFQTLLYAPVCTGAQSNILTIEKPTDVSNLATSSDLSAVASDVTDIKAKTDALPQHPAAVGSEMALTSETVTSIKNGLATSDGLSSLASHGDTYWVTADISGLATGGGLEALASYGDNHWTTADVSNLATTSDLSVAQTALTALINSVLSGLFHWAVEGSIFTIYNASNVAIGVYTLTKDNTGNITAVTPIVQQTTNSEE